MNLQLSEQQALLRDSLERLFQNESTSARIRAAEPLGYDPALWTELVGFGLPLMRVPEGRGGGGLALIDAVVVAETLGSYLASVPLIECAVASRILADIAPAGHAVLEDIAGGSILTVALHPVEAGVPQLVPAGAIADRVLCSDGATVYLAAVPADRTVPANLGTLPLAAITIDLDNALVLASGPDACAAWQAGIEEWKLLAAANIAAMGRKALEHAAAYASEREAFGRPIGSFQGLAHPLADAVTDVEGAQLLCWRAASEAEPSARAAQISAALWWSTRAASAATIRAMRTFGGYGVSMEYDAQIYFRRARAWSMLLGDPEAELNLLGDCLWGGRTDPVPDIGSSEISFGLGDAAEAYAAEARAFFAAHMTPEMRRFIHETDDGDHPFNTQLAKAGFLYADWPAALGGGDRTPYEMAALNDVYCEFEWPRVPGTVTHMVGKILMHFASEEVKEEVLPGLASGERNVALGYSEPSAGSDIFAAKTRATRDGDDWIIDGQKMFTSQGHLADYVLLIARTDPALPKHAGLTLFLVPVSIPGFEVHEIKTLGGERTNITYYSDMRVPDRYRIGDVNGGTKVLGLALALEQGGGDFFVSALRIMLRHALAWAHAANTQGERPIDRRRVRARLAQCHARLLVADVLDRRCLWGFVSGQGKKYYGPMAKLFASEALVSCSSELVELAAPWSLIQAHTDLGTVELESRKAIQATIYGGTSEVQRSIVAESALGLPRTRS
ncbi:acyl-CoA dehydrogenase [Sphingomonas azotifigens]|uniref:acyl-CoA dehydrogenase n=1 Tax=Sphingomonas azotifigens TaxID=330920 RepID=UPI0009FE73B7|nr:acyl-CoA dehydrogenase family protein [Sphingomonas azotifigens]